MVQRAAVQGQLMTSGFASHERLKRAGRVGLGSDEDLGSDEEK
jgi:hypothetical protein